MKIRQLVILLVLAGVVVSLLFRRFGIAKDDARIAGVELEQCQRIADEISLLRNSPVLAAEYDGVAFDIARRIQDAATASGITSDSIIEIEPGREQRIAGSEYVQINTTLEIVGVTMQQLVSFVLEIEQARENIVATSLRLRPSIQEPDDELWQVEITFQNLYHKPT